MGAGHSDEHDSHPSGCPQSEEAWFDDTLPKLAPDVDPDWLDDQVAQNMGVQRYIDGVGFLAATDILELKVGDRPFRAGLRRSGHRPRIRNRTELEAVAEGTTRVDGPVVAQLEPTDVPFRWVSRQQAEEYLEDVHPTDVGT